MYTNIFHMYRDLPSIFLLPIHWKDIGIYCTILASSIYVGNTIAYVVLNVYDVH